MFSIEPVERLSRMSTSCPCSSSASARCDPMNPAPPVMKALTIVFLSAEVANRRGDFSDECLVESRMQRQRQHLLARHRAVWAFRGLRCRRTPAARESAQDSARVFRCRARSRCRRSSLPSSRPVSGQDDEQMIDVSGIAVRAARRPRIPSAPYGSGAASVRRRVVQPARNGRRARRIAACISSSREFTPNSWCSYRVTWPPFRSRRTRAASAASLRDDRRRRRPARRDSWSGRS